MYSWQGEYWEEALAYIVILAYFLQGGSLLTLTTEAKEKSLSFHNFQRYNFQPIFSERKMSMLGMIWYILPLQVNLSFSEVG